MPTDDAHARAPNIQSTFCTCAQCAHTVVIGLHVTEHGGVPVFARRQNIYYENITILTQIHAYAQTVPRVMSVLFESTSKLCITCVCVLHGHGSTVCVCVMAMPKYLHSRPHVGSAARAHCNGNHKLCCVVQYVIVFAKWN